jgi:hypothetical protein
VADLLTAHGTVVTLVPFTAAGQGVAAGAAALAAGLLYGVRDRFESSTARLS